MADNTTPNREEWLSSGQAAQLITPPITVTTLLRWERDGLIQATRTRGGHRRFKRTEIEALTAALPGHGSAANTTQPRKESTK